MDLKELQELYKDDRFATGAGCKIVEANEERTVCDMEITEALLNARGGVMGGAIFTLADFAFAVASNYSGVPSVTVECNIRYFPPRRGISLQPYARQTKKAIPLGTIP